MQIDSSSDYMRICPCQLHVTNAGNQQNRSVVINSYSAQTLDALATIATEIGLQLKICNSSSNFIYLELELFAKAVSWTQKTEMIPIGVEPNRSI